MNYISADFQLHYISSYTLYIQSDTIKDTLIVVDAEQQVLVFMSYDNLAPSAELVKLLSMPFQKVLVGLPHEQLIWVPAEVYDDTEKDLYLDYFADIKVVKLLSKSVPEVEAVGLYNYDILSFNKWKNIFPEAQIIPSFDVFLKQVLAQMDYDSEVLGIHFYDNQVDLCLFLNNEMRLYNTFEVATADDLSYFVLSIMKNFSITGKIQKIMVSGVSLDSEWGHRLAVYTQQLVQVQSSTEMTCDSEEINSQIKILNTLTDLATCV